MHPSSLASKAFLRRIAAIGLATCFLTTAAPAIAADNLVTAPRSRVVSVSGSDILFDGTPIKIIGLRTSNALMSDATLKELLDNLSPFKSYGVNTVSVFVMGSRFGDVKGFRPDTTLDPVYASRLEKVIEAANERGMIVLVGCLYWSESEAKAELGHWTQKEANQAVANVVRWLKERGYKNVIVDPDNEGMANKEKGWDIGQMIAAGHAVNPECVIAYNARPTPPPNANLGIHFSPRIPGKPYFEAEGTPGVVPYWHSYSRRENYRNYINIGIYSDEMKLDQQRLTRREMEGANGYVLASTWLQAPPHFGPNMRPEGNGTREDPGIRWWLEFIRDNYGPAAKGQNRLEPEEARLGWKLLWDGKSTRGWRGTREETFPTTRWKIEQGVLSVLKAPEGAAGSTYRDIVTSVPYTDYEFSVDFRLSSGANSGIKYAVPPANDRGQLGSVGLEYQLIDDERHPDAKEGKDGNRTLASLYDLYVARGKRAHAIGQWNTARIVVRGTKIEHWLNERRVLEYDRVSAVHRERVEASKYKTIAGFGLAKSGHLLLQDHGDAVDFRNIKLRELPAP